jgi:hypothetical protein
MTTARIAARYVRVAPPFKIAPWLRDRFESKSCDMPDSDLLAEAIGSVFHLGDDRIDGGVTSAASRGRTTLTSAVHLRGRIEGP